ncbi:MAG: AmmeMemoRadiSam system protein B [Deltaproteobacteria bacterium]|nr:AmmeMemoRadiSam system protein B [Deltaproteobacteria bacterium]
MAIRRSLVSMLIFFLAAALPADGTAGEDYREAFWAGHFYPADSSVLTADIARMCDTARHDSFTKPAGKVLKALVLPHAGYIYSGPTAAHAALVLEKGQFDKVILLGPDHRAGLNNGAITDAAGYRTPLGTIPLHADAGRLLQQTGLFKPFGQAVDKEHSLEVILPFLQYLLGPFSLVPIVLGPAQIEQTAAALDPLLTPQTLLVVSSDLSHYMEYEAAERKDRQTICTIINRDGKALAASPNSACGTVPLQVLIDLANRHNWQPLLLHYANSGDIAGSRDKVVGYAAIAFYGDTDMDKQNSSAPAISPQLGGVLLTLARQTIALKLGLPVDGEEQKKLEEQMREKEFQQKRGTFVTLNKNGQLRGCIGSIAPVESVASGIRRNAVNAAFDDPRFQPVQRTEFSDLEIEVSILTDPKPLAYKDGKELLAKLRPGVDGVILRQGLASATFLPQVWDQLPRTEEFLGHLCRKAGLSADAWQTGRLEVLTYQVQHFSE